MTRRGILRTAFFTLFLSAAVLFSPGTNAYAATELFSTKEACIVNGTLTDVAYAASNDVCQAAADIYASDLESLKDSLRQVMVDRKDSLLVYYQGPLYEAYSAVDDFESFMDEVYGYDSPHTSSDYDYLDYNTESIEISVMTYLNYAEIEFKMDYLTTESQEDYTDQKIAEIMSGLDLDEASQYEKVKAVHSYIVDHVEYDDDLEKYSAYEGLYSGETVCQGYALLAYKLLTEAGVPTKIIGGESFGDGHAWNIVKIGDYWYNLDVTWDDSTDSRDYFLKGKHAFSDHKLDDEYQTDEFVEAYPLAPSSFSLDDDVTLVGSIVLSDSATGLNCGGQLQLEAVVGPEDATDSSIGWSSSNSSVATVDSNGLVIAHQTGSAVISATAADSGAKSATCRVSVYDLSTASAWASGDIEALSGRGVIPSGVLTSFGSQISRAEFTALLVNIYEYTQGTFTPSGETPFTDIVDAPYQEEIIKGYKLGIINGSSNSLFKPDSTLTREQCAKIIAVTASLINGDSTNSQAELSFTDKASIASWALPYVKNAYANGLMTGIGTAFSPKGSLTCQEALVIAERMIEKYDW